MPPLAAPLIDSTASVFPGRSTLAGGSAGRIRSGCTGDRARAILHHVRAVCFVMTAVLLVVLAVMRPHRALTRHGTHRVGANTAAARHRAA